MIKKGNKDKKIFIIMICPICGEANKEHRQYEHKYNTLGGSKFKTYTAKKCVDCERAYYKEYAKQKQYSKYVKKEKPTGCVDCGEVDKKFKTHTVKYNTKAGPQTKTYKSNRCIDCEREYFIKYQTENRDKIHQISRKHRLKILNAQGNRVYI